MQHNAYICVYARMLSRAIPPTPSRSRNQVDEQVASLPLLTAVAQNAQVLQNAIQVHGVPGTRLDVLFLFHSARTCKSRS